MDYFNTNVLYTVFMQVSSPEDAADDSSHHSDELTC
jgi:hypothetical protein